VTGVLLVGGASRRFGSPKALARFQGEQLAERAHRTLMEAFETVIAVGKEADRLPLPFPVHDDGSETRAPIVGVAAALRLVEGDIAVCLPTDMPFVSAGFLRALAEAAREADAAMPSTGPLPGAYRRTVLSVLERRIEAGELALRDALRELRTCVVDANERELRNVNTRDDLVA